MHILSIEIDGHFHGSSEVPKPWVAEIQGVCPKYGLQREFVRPMNDWAQASAAWSGNVYGRVARFPLRDGRVYEVSRLRGRSSKRYVAREFLAVTGSRHEKIEPIEALATADGGGAATTFQIPDDRDGTSWVAHVTGLGTPERLGFVIAGSDRIYRLRDGIHEVCEADSRRLIRVEGASISNVSERVAVGILFS